MAIRAEALAAIELLDALPMAVVLVDRTGVVSGWNAAAETLYGHPRDAAVGASFVDVLFDEADRDAAAALVDAAGRGVAWEGDFRVRRRDGALLVSSFRLAPAGAALGSAWLATDGIDQGLAEQERSVLLSAERAARATAEEALGLLEAILTSAPVGIAVFDLDLRYVRVNDAYAALSGVPADDHPGGQLGDVLPLQAGVAADLRRVVTTGRTILGRNVELVADEDGDARSFNVSYFPVRSAAGALVGAGLTLVEVTEAKRAEAERAALLRRAEAAHLRLSILATASTVLTTTMELDELLARLTRVLTPMAADWCVIELVDRDGAIEHVAVSHRARDAAQDLATRLSTTRIVLDGDSPVAAVLRSGQARLAGPEAIPELAGREPPLHSSVVVPIESRGRVHGVLVLATEGERQLADDDLDLAVEIAHRAALAVGNARAFQQEHEIAENLQRALLPTTVPAVPGLELAVRYVAATDGASVGGDWYDVLAFDDGTTGIVVGDVVGHDIAASTSMGQLRSAIRIYAWEEHARPAAALARVDRRFDKLGLAIATCMFGVLDRDKTFRWSNAGHPPPLLLRNGTATFLVEGSGVLLGVTCGEGMEEATTRLQEGDVLVLYTDGLVERRGEPLEVGLARLASAAERSDADDAEVLCEALLEALVPASATRDDDLAILVARVRADDPAPPGLHRMPFELKPESAALTRGFTAGVLEGAGWRDHVDTAVLLVSELVTNAVRHAQGPCALVVDLRDDEVEFAVEDGDPQTPVPREGRGLDESGRGLLLVGALADRWGVRAIPSGKAIWFSLARRHRKA